MIGLIGYFKLTHSSIGTFYSVVGRIQYVTSSL